MKEEVDKYFEEATGWKAELSAIRQIILKLPLHEEWKWRQPCYTSEGKNIAIVGILKDCCILSFFKGAMINDKASILQLPGKNTQVARYIKFYSIDDILKNEDIIIKYLKEAIAIEKSNLKSVANEKKDLVLIEELREFMKQDPKFKSAFESLTPGRQRGYLLFFEGAKQSTTRVKRIEKNRQRILDGYGIHDCTCGLSKRLPNCDGSHKQLQK